ncbi:diguanylate cyclase (GGDEF)-like protein/PAS domain S-box-containing protein [Mycolicibacterium sp. BK556]|uniref:diguanylate cyclase domain-containing protein n=1 Tax=Mycobacteriaceae TaxID=1762 RepID=UPI00105FAAB8|nr:MULTISPECIES: diguanylate cyclase [Mycobacteriaceae]MBB3602550.1 diguanylate cyclase (GGDEF)-like protein/PAS domain S-box-containing protein [Mycolicibacterium sp. BK556]MBB3632302.1 diguanylate cyclase (GGDEF)-like protein/PAS domain S-box-containing protein [Mycolicibacterium sp. BK607]MBB3750323.1 diguanylate cyclase (GGDEF)-like protein/PAS domain S-box-containing protein [Mycolicibacterium sp. BK634]TDO18408.1 PAS domain S-box-containing protein/diguanylate cyclase (GGDEF)-like protein
MAKTEPDAQLEKLVRRGGRAALAVVFGISASNWFGWATGNEGLTRIFRSWPQMTPWTALLLATLAAGVLVQSGQPSGNRVWVGRGLAAAAAAVVITVLAEYLTRRTFGLDLLWFPGNVSTLQRTWPGRPSPQTAVTVLLLAIAVGLTRVDRRWARVARTVGLTAAVAVLFFVITGYTMQTLSVVVVAPSNGMGIATAVGLALVVVAALAARPDWNPVAWLLTRPDGRALVRMMALFAALPIVTGLSRLAFLAVGVREDAVWALSISMSAVVIGVAVFYLSQREQRLLIDRSLLIRQREDAEARYRILAENAVDAVVHLRGAQVVWTSPSIQTTFGDAPGSWIGSDFSSHVHADDAAFVNIGEQRSGTGESPVERFRINASDGGFHWVDCRSKPYVDAEGNDDGVIAALRVVDDQVEFERRLEQLARFDVLTGLANRGEAIERLESALAGPRVDGQHIGVLFCDVDGFKRINDTYGHAVGDIVLATLAARIQESVRHGDTVGRTGGDELLVLLPGVRSLDEVATVAEAIRSRAAEPIDYPGGIIHATLSIGATLAIPGEDATAATARADEAMYRAKETGRNAVVAG